VGADISWRRNLTDWRGALTRAGNKKRMLRAAGLFVLLLALAWAQHPVRLAAQGGQAPFGKMAQAEVTISGQKILADVADTPELMALGLGGRRSLAPDRGMIFVYTDKGYRSFWMKGMYISIDIIWLDGGRVVHIEHDVPPPAPGIPLNQLPAYQPPKKADMVLELAAGRARQLGMKEGMILGFRFNIQQKGGE